MQVLLLGEEERGQKPYQILCFVNHIHANEFISPDAMAKLRQVIILTRWRTLTAIAAVIIKFCRCMAVIRVIILREKYAV